MHTPTSSTTHMYNLVKEARTDLTGRHVTQWAHMCWRPLLLGKCWVTILSLFLLYLQTAIHLQQEKAVARCHVIVVGNVLCRVMVHNADRLHDEHTPPQTQDKQLSLKHACCT